MTIVRVGTNQKYSDGWEAAFGKKKSAGSKSAAVKTATAKTATKSPKKAAGKKGKKK